MSLLSLFMAAPISSVWRRTPSLQPSSMKLARKYFSAWLLFFLSLSLTITAPSDLEAQTDRYELGRRVKRYEIAWQIADAQSRARSTASMQKAVSSFFALKFKSAARAIDEAHHQVKSKQPLSDLDHWLASRQIIVNQRVVDSTVTKLPLFLKTFYGEKISPPKNSKLRVTIRDRNDRLIYESKFSLEELKSNGEDIPFVCQWDTDSIGEGDFGVKVDLMIDGNSLPIEEFRYTRVNGLTSRLDSMPDSIKSVKATATPTGYQTLKLWRDRILGSCEEERLEIDYPVFQLLEQFDQLCKLGGDSTRFVQQANEREFWLSLRQERKSVPIRIRVPTDPSTPRPVLFVFHGAGGSDNMFFETYGAGRSIALADERDWIIVSPDQGLLSQLSLDCQQMLDLIEKHFPVDRKKVFFVGHSMGAAQVVTQVNKNPELAAAAVALGGGRRPRDSKRLTHVPWFIAAGEFDFGKRGAKALSGSIQASQGTVNYQEYKDVEHLVIVQAALEDVFAFLDRVTEEMTK